MKEEQKTEENGSSELEKVKKRIIRQVEFYFGDYNLIRDTFMKDKMQENDGWFSMDLMLQFKRLASICSEPSTIMEALKDADMGLLEIDVENSRIRRKPNREIPVDSEEYRKKMKAKTVHVAGFQSEESIDDIHEFISQYGKLEGIQLLRTPEKQFKGTLFATFFKLEDAQKFVQAPMVYYKCNELTKMFKTDFFSQEAERKKAQKRKASEEEEKDDLLKNAVAIKVSGVTDDTISHFDVKQVFESKGVKTIRFFDRMEHLDSDGYLIFEETRTAEELLKILEDNDGTKVTIKSAEVEFSKPDDEEKTKIYELYVKARERYFTRPGHNKGKKFQKFGKHKQKRSPRNPRSKRTTFDSDEEGGAKQDAVVDDEAPAAKVTKTEE